jgi:hypothetical protein
MSINDKKITNQDDLANMYDELGLDLNYKFEDYYIGYGSSVDAYNAAFDLTKSIYFDLVSIGGQKLPFREGTAYIIAH